MPAPTFYRPKFLDFMIEEYYACREGIGIIDMSSLSKIRITVSYILMGNTPTFVFLSLQMSEIPNSMYNFNAYEREDTTQHLR